ncbi:MAG: helix-turn-helix transcriptional regulator [Bacteroidetes bacterium]|nr:helix-turn-helix transcriptional regulator [Bacteroidota bacterium]
MQLSQLNIKGFENIGSSNECSVAKCTEVIGGKWKPIILFLMRKECVRFSEFLKAMPSISKQTLTNQLRELEKDQLVKRVVYNEMPPRVEYKFTPLGRTTLFLIDEMDRWGQMHMSKTR